MNKFYRRWTYHGTKLVLRLSNLSWWWWITTISNRFNIYWNHFHPMRFIYMCKHESHWPWLAHGWGYHPNNFLLYALIAINEFTHLYIIYYRIGGNETNCRVIGFIQSVLYYYQINIKDYMYHVDLAFALIR